MSILATVFLVAYFIFMMVIAIRSCLKSTRKELISFEVIFGYTKRDSFFTKSYFFWYLIRRIVLVGLVVFAEKSPRVQVSVSLWLCLLQLTYLVYMRPID